LEAAKEAHAEAKAVRLTVWDVQGFTDGGVPSAEGGRGGASRSPSVGGARGAEPPSGGGAVASQPGSAASSAAAAYAGTTAEQPRLVRKVKLEIAVNENFVEPTVRAIARAARL